MRSLFQALRSTYTPKIPAALSNLSMMECEAGPLQDVKPDLVAQFKHTGSKPLLSMKSGYQKIKQFQKLKVGTVLSGGPAPGGHNVLWGLHSGLSQIAESIDLFGFVGGPQGILEDQFKLLDANMLEPFRNSGGFDAIGTGRAKIETDAQLKRCHEVMEKHSLDALVIIGGDDSNTNAAIIAEYLASKGSSVCVIGVPKTIDSDLRNPWIETSFGFDTAVRVYAEMIANIGRDVLSTKKYYHFIRLMGRSASHITLEAALQTQPNLALIGEEIAAKKMTLAGLIDEIAALIIRRAAAGKNFGLILVPEGVIEFIPEFQHLMQELNQIIVEHAEYLSHLHGFTSQSEYIHRKLSKDASYTFSSLPIDIQRQMLMDRDPHGNVIVSRIETEKLIIELLISRLGELKAEGQYQGEFAYQSHFLGYEGRCAPPTNFDADYAFSLGLTAASLISQKASGYMAAIHGLTRARSEWKAIGIPLSSLLATEMRNGKLKPVISKALVDLESKSFAFFSKKRQQWIDSESYRITGPIQYFGPEALTDRIPCSLAAEYDATHLLSW